jgi:hypothetical protein
MAPFRNANPIRSWKYITYLAEIEMLGCCRDWVDSSCHVELTNVNVRDAAAEGIEPAYARGPGNDGNPYVEELKEPELEPGEAPSDQSEFDRIDRKEQGSSSDSDYSLRDGLQNSLNENNSRVDISGINLIDARVLDTSFRRLPNDVQIELPDFFMDNSVDDVVTGQIGFVRQQTNEEGDISNDSPLRQELKSAYGSDSRVTIPTGRSTEIPRSDVARSLAAVISETVG